jgi:tetratricopeptide (TPR) repeat protein
MVDDWLAAISAHVERIEQEWDPAVALDTGALESAKRLAEVLGEDDLAAWHMLGRFHMHRDTALYAAGGGWEDDNAAMMGAFARCFAADMDVPHDLREAIALYAADLAARTMSVQAFASSDAAAMTAVAVVFQRAVAVLPSGHPARGLVLANLCSALRNRYLRAVDPADVAAAVAVGRQAVDEAVDDERLPEIEYELAQALVARFELAADPADLEEAITIIRRALDGHPDNPEYADSYGRLLRVRFQHRGKQADLDEAVRASRRAVDLVSDEARPAVLPSLGDALARRFDETGDLADIDAAITAFRQAARGLPEAGGSRASCLSSLGTALRMRFGTTRSAADLDEAVAVGRQAVAEAQDTHPEWPIFLSNVGAALLLRATFTGQPTDLAEAIATLRTALATIPVGHSLRPIVLSNLSAALKTGQDDDSDPAVLSEAIALAREAVDAVPENHPDRGRFLLNLCGLLTSSYNQTDDLADVAEAVAVGRQMLEAIPQGHPNRVNALITFGSAVETRAGAPGRAGELDEAIASYREAVASLPEGHPARPETSCILGTTLRQRFQHTGDLADIEEAIEIFRSAVRTYGHDTADGGDALYDLGRALQARYENDKETGDLTAAIAAYREACSAPAADPYDLARRRWRLGEALRLRFEATGSQADIDEAVTLSRQAAEAVPAGRQNHTAYRLALGKALEAQARRGQAATLAGKNATRAELAASLAALVDINSSGELPMILAPGTLEDARLLAGLIETDGEPDLDTLSLLGRFYWLRYLALPADPDDEAGSIPAVDALDAAVEAYTLPFKAGRFVPDRLAPLVAEAIAEDVVTDLYDRVIPSFDTRLLTEAISVLRRLLGVLTDDDPGRPFIAGALGSALITVTGITAAREDLDAGIILLQEAVAALPDDDVLPVFQVFLSEGLRARLTLAPDPASLEQAVETARRAAEAASGTPEHAAFRAQLGMNLYTRFLLTGERHDLDEAIKTLSLAVDGLPGESLVLGQTLAWLSNALRLAFEMTGERVLLDQAITHATAALVVPYAGPIDRFFAVHALGGVLIGRAGLDGEQSDLDTAIALFADALEESPTGHPVHTAAQGALGQALLERFAWTGDDADIDAAIENCERAVAGMPRGNTDQARIAGSLARALLARYERAGSAADLDASIAVSRDTASAMPERHPDRAMYLSISAQALMMKFDRTDHPGYLDQSIQASRQALSAIPDGHAGTALYQTMLAAALRIRSILARLPAGTDFADLDLADIRQSGLAEADIEEAMVLLRGAAAMTPDGHFFQPVILGETGTTYLIRFAYSRRQADLDEAAAALRRAIASSAGRPTQVSYLLRLGTLLVTAHDETGLDDYLEEAVTAYTRVADFTAAAPSFRITAAQNAVRLIASARPQQAADLLETAVRLLPQAASRRLGRADQQRALGEFAFLTPVAAELALTAGGPGASARALGLLELGRGVLQGQALDTRRDLLDLYARHPRLANRFVELRDRLDAPDGPSLSALDPATTLLRAPGLDGAATLTEASPANATDRFGAATEFAALLDQIRELDGFESFLLPPAPDELTGHAGPGPIVTFTIGPARSDALIVTPDGITQLPMPGLAMEGLVSKIDTWEDAIGIVMNGDATPDDRRGAENTLSDTLEWLWDAAASPVLTHLGYNGPPEPGQPWPRIWWAPGGLLGMLPLHAAGHHRSPERHDTVLDRVVSSYTPTIRALAYARERKAGTSPR